MVEPVEPFRVAPACTGGTGTTDSPSVSINVIDFDTTAKRSDPNGALVRFDAGSDVAINRIDLDLDGDGEPAITVRFDVGVGFDGRYIRALAFKPTVNGTWPLVIKAYNLRGETSTTTCKPGMTVVF
jgi:hypothetical protein